MQKYMENKDMTRTMDNISNNFYSEKGDYKMLQLPYSVRRTVSR